MPGKKHMNQDRPVDGQDTLQTMQDKKSGIYQDRTAGKLPQGRVAQHYQDMDAKMEQATMKSMGQDLSAVANFVAGGGPFKDGAKSIKSAYNKFLKPTIDKAIDYKNKNFGENFLMNNVVGDLKSSAKGVKKALKKD